MRAPALIPALAAVALLSAGCGGDDDGTPPTASRGAPNVVVVMTDDQDARSLAVMRRTRRLIGGRGATFDAAIASFPLCCPSRATFLTGQYAHNHGAQGNFPDTDGGGYVSLTEPERTLPAWLKAAGYRTAHVGKWASAPGTSVPPGWDRWMATTAQTSARYYDFALTDGTGEEPLASVDQVRFGASARDYHTDVVTRASADLIRRWAPGRRPFFLSVAYLAPHLGAGRGDAATRRCSPGAPVPAERHLSGLAGRSLPRPPSLDEADVSDKPRAVVRDTRLDDVEIEALERVHRCRLASLLAVDEGVGRIIGALRAAGELGDTVLVFTSDNGYLLGEHRLAARKNIPYEEALRVPLLLAGPGIPAGGEVAAPVANLDLAPTILQLAGAEQPRDLARPTDGGSLVPLARGDVSGADRAILIEGRYDTAESARGFEVLSYVGVRTRRYLYAEHRRAAAPSREEGAATEIGAGERIAVQLYDMQRDPFQLENEAGTPAYRDVRRELRRLLARLEECEGSSCLAQASVPAPDAQE